MLLPETEPQEAKRLLERILQMLEVIPVQHEEHQIELSFSAGVTGYSDGATVNDLIKHADIALYEGKEHGRASVLLNLPNSPTKQQERGGKTTVSD